MSAVVERLCQRWLPGGVPAGGLPGGPAVRLLPMSDDDVETHVHLTDGRTVHFQEWWVRLRASVPATGFSQVGVDVAKPAPGVLQALRDADAVLLPPSNPVVSIGTVLGVPGVREALRDGGAPVVGVSPILGGKAVRGMADACLSAIGVETSALGVAGLYADLLDSWLVDDDADGALHGTTVPGAAPGRGRVLARPLLMSSPQAAADLAGAALSTPPWPPVAALARAQHDPPTGSPSVVMGVHHRAEFGSWRSVGLQGVGRRSIAKICAAAVARGAGGAGMWRGLA
ncbi:MAG: 2-phospho-L-lactate transferase CofD family protein [Quadrisphaera sp.]